MLVLSLGEMAEWLKALVLKVLAYPGKPYKSRVSLMFDIGVLFLWGQFDGRNARKKLPSDFAENRMAGVSEIDSSDGKGKRMNTGISKLRVRPHNTKEKELSFSPLV
jgi:hypothetical protein